jgi:hypothetical protein|tara:strand:+ start:260 stop:457 length:198 start_codon:yes stop_codon:yes gene_type:complete
MAKKETETVEEEPKEEKAKTRYELVEVPTQTAVMIRDNQTETVFQDSQVLLEILNKIDKIDKNTG